MSDIDNWNGLDPTTSQTSRFEQSSNPRDEFIS